MLPTLPIITLAVALLAATLAFAVLAWCAEREALRQMDADAYRHVPLVRAARYLRIPAMLCTAGFVGLCWYATPATLIAYVLTCVMAAVLTHYRYLVHLEGLQWLLRSLLPMLLVSSALANLSVLTGPGNTPSLPTYS